MSDDRQVWPPPSAESEEFKVARDVLSSERPVIVDAFQVKLQKDLKEFLGRVHTHIDNGEPPVQAEPKAQRKLDPWEEPDAQHVDTMRHQGYEWVKSGELLRRFEWIHTLVGRMDARGQLIAQLQKEIQDKDAEHSNLREQIASLEQLNTAQSEKIRFWTETSEKQEKDLHHARSQDQAFLRSSLMIEGERNALTEVARELVQKLIEVARG